jgi:carbonic anhydrase
MNQSWRTAGWRLLVAGACTGSLAAGHLASSATTRAAEPVTFEYSGDSGPAFWGELSPEWSACSGAGGRQTPIDISPSENLPSLAILTRLQFSLRPTAIELVNTGHTLELEYEPGSTLTFNGVVYDLLQFHFHTLSEHTVDGARYPMEQHAVFKDSRTGNLAVLGMFYKIGAPSSFLGTFTDLPLRKGQRVESHRTISLADSLTSTDSYFAYRGSLTTPPCSEIVTWFVLKTPAEMSQAQFEGAWRIMGNNFRPTQPRSPSLVVFSTPR